MRETEEVTEEVAHAKLIFKLHTLMKPVTAFIL